MSLSFTFGSDKRVCDPSSHSPGHMQCEYSDIAQTWHGLAVFGCLFPTPLFPLFFFRFINVVKLFKDQVHAPPTAESFMFVVAPSSAVRPYFLAQATDAADRECSI